MNTQATPFGTLSDLNTGPGTAPAREIAFNPHDMDLGEHTPRAINPMEVDKRLTRWLVFVGDVISPKQKRERPDLLLGGEYFGQQYATLVRSKGLVRRCQLTPMEIGFDFINDEIMGENTTGLVVVERITAGEGRTALHGARSLNAVELFPGDEIRGILHREHNATNGVKGFIEVEALRGVEYADVREAGYQEFVFPEWRQIVSGMQPIENRINALRRHFESRHMDTSDPTLQRVIEAYLESCDRYTQWGLDYLKMSAQLVRQPMIQGFAHTYSDQAELLFKQLEVNREDALRMAADAPPLQGQVATTNEDVKELMHQMVQFQGQVAEILKAQQGGATAPAPEPQVPATEPQPGHVDVEPSTPIKKEEEPQTAQEKTEVAQETNELQATLEDGRPRCQVRTSSGAQCLQPAMEGSDACAHPAHKR